MRSSIILMTIGILFLGVNLGWWPGLMNLLATWWPLILIALGVSRLLNRRSDEEHV
ncbi:DUF5668 domain-containing protein [Chitinibacter sp. SCUT-21]|uniref:LiaF transmembrane domain-containing protein n=1 Tax=Chitinibacter sp. SCUT-21 TaxID=2970891 RepID=UPI0035A6E960